VIVRQLSALRAGSEAIAQVRLHSCCAQRLHFPNLPKIRVKTVANLNIMLVVLLMPLLDLIDNLKHEGGSENILCCFFTRYSSLYLE
jgi:hypothetical protein